MTSFEDHFSEQARQYASNRPRYPGELFAYLASISPDHQLAWDCGTGNGQAAQELAKHFNRVFATDASPDQIAQAVAHERIEYRVERAEQVSLEPGSVDLVTVATAVHWFDYLAERYRTLPFPFEELNPPNFEMQAEWELGRLVGFLDSWSATRRYACRCMDRLNLCSIRRAPWSLRRWGISSPVARLARSCSKLISSLQESTLPVAR